MNGPNNPIGWTDFTWNPVKGFCPAGCDYCYAHRIYKRFHYDPAIRLDEKELLASYKLKNPTKIFVGSTIELFGLWVPESWIKRILEVAQNNPRHIFQFLTHFPIEMKKFDFPANCWCGVTVTHDLEWLRIYALAAAECSLRFVSFEPLHGFIFAPLRSIDWIIIGAETGNREGKIVPEEDWIAHIIAQADYWNIPIFMKDNIKLYWPDRLRQEFPRVGKR